MIARVCARGKSAPGLLRYLYGPGKANEHTDPHLVAGSGALPVEWAGQLSGEEAHDLGRVVEGAWRASYVERLAYAGVGRGGVSHDVLATGGGPGEQDKEHVYHVALSLAPGERFTDEQWAAVASDFVDGMGFTTGPDDDRGAAWVAVRHGLSAGGNDHLHLAMSLVRQDGRRVNLPRNDFGLAQTVRRHLEDTHTFVAPLHDRGAPTAGRDLTPGQEEQGQERGQGRSLPGYTPKEHADARARAAAGTGSVVPDRVRLQQMVRGAAHTSGSEVEWIQTLVQAGVELEVARWAPGGRDEVTGYKVRLGEGVWFSASKLADDLTLTYLRRHWIDTPGSREHALVLWREETPPSPTLTPPPAGESLDAATAALTAWNAGLARLDPHDRAAWERELTQAAGTVSVLAQALGPVGEVAGYVADVLTRQSLTGRPVRQSHGQNGRQSGDGAATWIPVGSTLAEVAARHIALALRASSPDQHRGWVAVLRQLERTVAAVRDAQEARGDLAAATALARDGAPALASITLYVGAATPHSITPAEAVRVPSRWQAPGSREQLRRAADRDGRAR